MYVCNGTKDNAVSDRRDTSLRSVLEDVSIDRGEPIIEIGAYALMPNHPHFIFKELKDGGITSFMRKLFTGYTMYFNKKYKRTGALFAGAFKSKHIDDDNYLKRVMAYVLLNPAELFAPKWKEGVADISSLKKELLAYSFASTADFFGCERPEGKIAHFPFSEFYDEQPTLLGLLEDARSYYTEINKV